MFRRIIAAAACLLSCATAALAQGDNPGRALTAINTKDGVYLSWRSLPDDGGTRPFDVFKVWANGQVQKLNSSPVQRTTDFLDKSPRARGDRWYVQARVSNERSSVVSLAGDVIQKPYLSIPMPQTGTTAGAITFSDFDGDGFIDYTIRVGAGSTDPYYKYWHANTATYRLLNYSSSGKFISTYDFGPGIERGIWYAPFLTYDLDGDGKAELVTKDTDRRLSLSALRDSTGRVVNGPEYLAVYDPVSLKRRATGTWPSRDGFNKEASEKPVEQREPYNRASRNQMAIAHLDGSTPHVIVERGTYGNIFVKAFRFDGQKLHQVWEWNNVTAGRGRGRGAHTIKVADLDGDGRDEVIIGMTAIDDDGTTMWHQGLGHADHIYLADFLPDRPGLELYYGLEDGRPEGGGMGLLGARTGEPIWQFQGATKHIHDNGMCADIDAAHPGPECLSAESDRSGAWMWSANGRSLDRTAFGTAREGWAAYWDADEQREPLINNSLRDYPSLKPAGPEIVTGERGRIIAVADVFGDWREEIFVSLPGELRIYASTIPATSRHSWLFTDRVYRSDVTVYGVGYPQLPLPSRLQ